MAGHIKEISRGRYRIVVEAGKVGGKRKRIVRYKGRKSEAEELLAQLMTELKQGTYVEPTKVTLGECLDIWLEEYKKPRLRQTTYESYELMIRRHIKPVLGNVPLQNLRTDQLQRLYNQKSKEGLAPATVRRIHQVVHGAMDQAVKTQMVLRNVSKATTLPALNKREIRALTPEEANKFIDILGSDRLGVAFLVLLGTGLRRGELLGLTWQDVNLNEGTIHVREGVTFTREGLLRQPPKTEKGKRIVPLPALLVEKLKEHRSRMFAEGNYHKDSPVFCTQKGRVIIPP